MNSNHLCLVAWSLPALLLLGCSDAGDGANASTILPPCMTGDLAATNESVGFASPCEGTALHLLPRVSIDGVWHGGGDEGACSAAGSEIKCPAGAAGEVSASIVGAQVTVRFEASAAVTVEALSLEGDAQLPGATAWLSNGFQSWSQTGVIAIGAAPEPQQLAKALEARGDGEVDRYGNELSWWYSFAGGGEYALFAGAMSGERFKPWVQISRGEGDRLAVRLVAGGAGEKVAVAPGETVTGESWRLGLGSSLTGMLAEWGRAIPSRRSAHPVEPLRGWNSWYELWDKVDEEAIRANAALVKETFVYSADKPFYVVVDDGWQKKWGEWEPNDKFPSGLSGLASSLHADGFKAGVWLAPLLVHEDSVLVTDHPDWFVQDAVYQHSLNGLMRILDVTNPEAAAHLAEVIGTLTSWGLDFLKIDFLFAGTYEGKRAKDVTGMQAYAEALRIIREAAGDQLIIVAVGAPPIASFPYVDGWRLGGDIALEPFGPSWYFVLSQARSLAARWPLCEATLCDADPPLLRTLPDSEVNVGIWVAAAARGLLFLSDDLRKLPDSRLHWTLTELQRGTLASGGGRIPRTQIPDQVPVTLTNAVIDQVSRKSQHAIPSVWDATGASSERLTINFTDEPLVEGNRSVAPHTADEWRPPQNE